MSVNKTYESLKENPIRGTHSDDSVSDTRKINYSMKGFRYRVNDKLFTVDTKQIVSNKNKIVSDKRYPLYTLYI